MASAALVLLVVVTAALALAVGTTSARAEETSGEIVIRIAAEPASLHPYARNDAVRLLVDSLVHEPLLRRDPASGRVVPGLASVASVDAEHRVVRLELRPGFSWHDGSPVRPADVVATLRYLIDDGTPVSPAVRSRFARLEAAEPVGENGVAVTFRDGIVRADELLASRMLTVLSSRQLVVEARASEGFGDGEGFVPIGCGPYRVASWDRGQRLVLERFERYGGASPAANARLVLRPIPDATAAFLALISGEVDFDFALSTEQYLDAVPRSERALNRMLLPGFTYNYVAWNLRRAPLDETPVRRALSMLFDRAAMAEHLYRGLAEPSTGPFLPGSPGCDPGVKPPRYDPDEARRLLVTAGFRDRDDDGLLDRDGASLELRLIHPGGALGERIVRVFAEAAGSVGVRVRSEALEWKTFQDRLARRDFDGALLGRTVIEAEQNPSVGWHGRNAGPGGANHTGFTDGDALLASAEGEADRKRRAAILRTFHRLVGERQPAAFLHVVGARVAYSADLRDVYPVRTFPGFDPRVWHIK